MRLTEMIVNEQNLWGKPVTRLAVNEFQKRGTPHIHLLVWLEDFDPVREASQRFSRSKRAYLNKGVNGSSS